jgi:cytochrome c
VRLGVRATLCGLGVLALAASAQAADLVHGKAVFAKCAACHALHAGGDLIGPSLKGVVGRRAGAVRGYDYSPAMKHSGETWDPETLNAYLAFPRALIPRSRMAFQGLDDPQDRGDLIAYLRTAR